MVAPSRFHVFLLVLFVSFLPIICSAQTNPTFTGATPFQTGGTQPFAVAVGDLNGDGKPDLVVVNADQENVAVMLGNGDGTFRQPVTYSLSSDGSGPEIALADFNNDGKLDVAVAVPSSPQHQSGDIIILLGNGDGTLGPPTHLPGYTSPWQLIAVDLNGDKKADLLISGNGPATIFYGKGDGTFQPPVQLQGQGNGNVTAASAVADVNGDGRLDIVSVTATFNPEAMLVYLQNPDQSFATPTIYTLSAAYQGTGSITAGDINGNGKADVVLGANGSGQGAIFYGNGDGTFQSPVKFTVFSGINTMLLADFNNDKKPELEAANYQESNIGVLVFTNPGNGMFNWRQGAQLQTGGGTTQAAYGDFNGDGLLDVVSSDSTANVVSVFLNTLVPTSATLWVGKSGAGIVASVDGHIYCGSTCYYLYSKETVVSLSAVPAPGYTFAGWTGCDNANGIYCSETMTSPKNVTASFTAANVTLTSLTFKPTYVKGGRLSAGTLTLKRQAPPGGVTVALGSDHPGVAHPPSFVFVPGGQSSLGFAVNTLPVKSSTTVTITATAGSSQVSGTLTVGTTSLPPSVK